MRKLLVRKVTIYLIINLSAGKNHFRIRFSSADKYFTFYNFNTKRIAYSGGGLVLSAVSISRSLVSDDDDGDGEGMAVCWRQRRRLMVLNRTG